MAVDRRMQFRLVQNSIDTLLAIGLVEHAPASDFEFTLPDSLPIVAEGDLRLDIWADENGSGGYNTPPIDGGWQVPVEGVNPGVVNFARGTDVVDISGVNSDGGLSLSATGLGSYIGAAMEMTGIEMSTGRVVWRYVAHVSGDQIGVGVSHVFYQGVLYEIDVAIDANGNGQYEGAPDDLAWHFANRTPGPRGDGEEAGIIIEFEATEMNADLEL
jgi:hypothetical protein